MRRLISTVCLGVAPIFTGAAFAQDAPRVVADIAPVRAVVAQIMEGVGEPQQILPTGASPHGYAMRPSEARALREADLVVWVGPALTLWLEEPLDTLAGTAARLTLMDIEGTTELPLREAEFLKADADADGHDHDHDPEKEHADEHGDKHGDEHADDHEGEHGDEHAGEHGEEKGHDDAHDHDHAHHGDVDPHGWLDLDNILTWGEVIAHDLAELDPANKAIYARNWAEMRDEVTALRAEITDTLSGVTGEPFIVLHDAFQYFEASFGVEADAFIIPGDGSAPGPARLKALRDYLADHPATCAFTAPQENESLMRTAVNTDTTRFAVLDPIGDGAKPYAELMRSFAADMAGCLSKS
ncbi:MAG: zinc ABC transporter substrate-binding protein [Sulfitobacter sp.]